ncbi:hypothetical protein QCA50_011968 [Cerrena zonata]|uniref:PWI domain-containing protein n=1 Tax=Cerrena zonata TaxID=2478898 RepID=A0AAW0FX22_9APHY
MYKVKEVEEDYVARQNSRELSRLKLNKIFDIKVNFAIVKKWIYEQLNQILPDDDIVMDYLCEMLTQDENPDIKVIHLQMKEFMGEDDSKKFCKKLWLLLNSAQQDPDGIPKEILEKTKRKLEPKEVKEPKDFKEQESKEPKDFKEQESKEQSKEPKQESKQNPRERRTNYNRSRSPDRFKDMETNKTRSLYKSDRSK